MSKLVPPGRRTTRTAGKFIYSCAVPVGRWWAARYTQRDHPGKVHNPPECVDDTRTVLVRSHLRNGGAPPAPEPMTGLPVGGVHSGDDDADMDLAKPRFRQIAIDEPRTEGSPVCE
jgi:hypothetical protein